MPRKKKEEIAAEEKSGDVSAEATEETALQAQASDDSEAIDEKSKGTRKLKSAGESAEATKSESEAAEGVKQESAEEPGILASLANTVSSAIGSVTETVTSAISDLVSSSPETVKETGRGNRAQKIGVVTSDKMTKTVVVRVDRLVKHPKYRRYVRRKKQFMAHDETGATIGDKVRIIETRPLSARKRWRVVEIVHKAAK